MRRWFLMLLSFCVLSLAFGADRLNVVVTIPPLGSLTRELVGDKGEVIVLLPPGASPHVYEPTADKMKLIARADLFVENGAGLEMWAEKMLKGSSNRKLVLVEASKGIKLIGAKAGHEGKRTRGGNPHVWLDPILAKKMAHNIEKGLEQVDPENKAYYRENLRKLQAKLDALDREIRRRIGGIRDKRAVVFHPAWDYFARRYGIQIVGVVEKSPGKSPTPRDIATIIREIKRYKVKVIFIEPQFNPKVAEMIAHEANVKLATLDPLGSSKEDYFKLMRRNLKAIEEVFR